MKRTIVQIAKVLIILLLVLMIPLFIESHNAQKGVKKTPQLTEQAAVSVEVLGVSTSREQEKKSSGFITLEDIQKVGVYTLIPLFIISIISFTKFKIKKNSV